jgi:nitroreductase
MVKEAKEMDLDELAQQMHLRPDSIAHLAAHAEFIRRQTEAQLGAAHAQIVAAQAEEMAAKASIATADATKTNARYLLASVIIAAISAFASAAAACYSYWNSIMK